MGYEIKLLILVHCDFKKEGGVGRRGHRIREVARRFAGPIARRSLAHSFRRKRRSFHFCFWGEAKSWRRLEALWRKVNWIPRLLAWHANSVVLNTMMEFDKYWKKSTTSRRFLFKFRHVTRMLFQTYCQICTINFVVMNFLDSKWALLTEFEFRTLWIVEKLRFLRFLTFFFILFFVALLYSAPKKSMRILSQDELSFTVCRSFLDFSDFSHFPPIFKSFTLSKVSKHRKIIEKILR